MWRKLRPTRLFLEDVPETDAGLESHQNPHVVTDPMAWERAFDSGQSAARIAAAEQIYNFAESAQLLPFSVLLRTVFINTAEDSMDGVEDESVADRGLAMMVQGLAAMLAVSACEYILPNPPHPLCNRTRTRTTERRRRRRCRSRDSGKHEQQIRAQAQTQKRKRRRRRKQRRDRTAAANSRFDRISRRGRGGAALASGEGWWEAGSARDRT